LELLELSLADNLLESGLDELEEKMPKLRLLNLTGNKFKSVESLTPLKNLHFLEHLLVYDCPLTDKDTYRSEIFELLTNLKSLDGFSKDGKSVKVIIET
ncbi:leucine-rich repeat protein, partial [Salmonella sp. s51228]|uniref:leucine-rich repeat protein n=1 Tax=Salmonella sp. s51228 TaxID=3159652 RepID=UPI003980DBB9